MLLRKMWLISIIALAATVIFYSCGQKADDITYTAKSSEALEIFLQGLEKDDAFYIAQARKLYKNAIELDPEFAVAHYYLALSSPTTQEYLDHFNNAIKLSGSVSEPERLIILRAKALFENEIYLAREYTEKLAELLPNGKRNRYLNGNFYFGRQEWEAAENEYQTAITIDPKFAPAYNMLSYTLSNLEKYPEAIESGGLRIYNSQVSDIEFLLTRSAVLLAFPQIPRKAGSHAGEISFGIYCKDDDFSKNLIQWYRTFLVDARFGWIRTESELDTTINELEEETFQDKPGDESRRER